MEGGSYDLNIEQSGPVANSVSEALSTQVDAPKVLSQRVVGVFQGVRNLTDAMKVSHHCTRIVVVVDNDDERLYE
jgi:hypothetical protein